MVKKFHGDPFSMVILFHGNDYHKTSLPYNEKKSMVRLFTINTIYGYHGMPTPGAQHGISAASWMQQSFPTKLHASRFVMQVGEFVSCTPKIEPTFFGFSHNINYIM